MAIAMKTGTMTRPSRTARGTSAVKMSSSTSRPTRAVVVCSRKAYRRSSPSATATASKRSVDKANDALKAGQVESRMPQVDALMMAAAGVAMTPMAAQAAELTPSLKNLIGSVVAGGTVLGLFIGAVYVVASFDKLDVRR